MKILTSCYDYQYRSIVHLTQTFISAVEKIFCFQTEQNFLKTMGGKSSKDSLSEEDLNLLVSSTNISAQEIQVILSFNLQLFNNLIRN